MVPNVGCVSCELEVVVDIIKSSLSFGPRCHGPHVGGRACVMYKIAQEGGGLHIFRVRARLPSSRAEAEAVTPAWVSRGVTASASVLGVGGLASCKNLTRTQPLLSPRQRVSAMLH